MAHPKGEFDKFRDIDLERTIREKYYAYFGRVLKKIKRIDLEKLLPVIESIEDSGKINERQSYSLLQLDLIVEGINRNTGKQVVLAVEVSYCVNEKDLNNAIERAKILAIVLDKEVIPTIIGVEANKEIMDMADEKGVLIIMVEY